MKVSIIDFDAKYQDSVRVLNEEWLRKYFSVEPSDKVQLGDPKKYILDKGGYICFARTDDGRIVGVGAIMVSESGVYELSKMAVTQEFQGRGIGRMIAERCLQVASEAKVEKVILYTNAQLRSAIHLYETLGFQQVPLRDSPYQRGDTRMELEMEGGFGHVE